MQEGDDGSLICCVKRVQILNTKWHVVNAVGVGSNFNKQELRELNEAVPVCSSAPEDADASGFRSETTKGVEACLCGKRVTTDFSGA